METTERDIEKVAKRVLGDELREKFKSLLASQLTQLPFPIYYFTADGQLRADRFPGLSGDDVTCDAGTLRVQVLNPRDSLTGDVAVGNNNSEFIVHSVVIPAYLLKVGRVFHLYLYGRYSVANGSDTMTVKIKLDTTTLRTKVSTTGAVTDKPFSLHWVFTVRAEGETGTFIDHLELTENNVHLDIAATTATVVDTTAENTINVTIQWSAADAGNTWTLTQGWWEIGGQHEIPPVTGGGSGGTPPIGA